MGLSVFPSLVLGWLGKTVENFSGCVRVLMVNIRIASGIEFKFVEVMKLVTRGSVYFVYKPNTIPQNIFWGFLNIIF